MSTTNITRLVLMEHVLIVKGPYAYILKKCTVLVSGHTTSAHMHQGRICLLAVRTMEI